MVKVPASSSVHVRLSPHVPLDAALALAAPKMNSIVNVVSKINKFFFIVRFSPIIIFCLLH